MKFSYEKNVYVVDVDKVFKDASPNDYIDYLDALGVAVHMSFPNQIKRKVAIVYDNIRNKISVDIFDDKDDEEYTTIQEKNLTITKEERDVIVNKLSVNYC